MKMVTVAALFVAYQLLLLAILGGRSLPGLQPGLCTALGLAIQFSFLAAFCWMSAMAGEVWATFRQLAGSNYSGKGVATLYLSIYVSMCLCPRPLPRMKITEPEKPAEPEKSPSPKSP